jgi:ribonuclease HI
MQHVTLPVDVTKDKLVWKDSADGEFSAKIAYEFKRHHLPNLDWAKSIWCIDIPPSKSLITWRLMHDKLATDENLKLRGCSLPSICSLCSNYEESTFHLFFECSFSSSLWCWLASILNQTLNFQSIEDLWKLCDRGWNAQRKLVIKATIVNIINMIWLARNNMRFNNKKTTWHSAIALICSNVALSGNKTKLLASRSIRDFSIIKYFNINIHPPKAPQIKEVIWCPPSSGWIKCNTDGAASSVTSSCGGIFRNFLADMVCCFAQNTGQGSAFHAELCGAMSAIEIAHSFHWRQLWIETDSSLVVKAFKNDAIIPWKLRNRWSNCNSLLINMKVIVSHVFREGNSCADSLARIGLDLENLTIWFKLPSVVRDSFLRNKLGLPSYRLTNL